MRLKWTHSARALAAAAALLLGGCVVEDNDGGDKAAAAPAAEGGAGTAAPAQQPAAPAPAQPMPQQPATPAPPPPPELRLEINVGEREVYAYRGEERVATYPVAVGTSEWPTRTGEWTIGQVIWNPEWIPPAESWAEKEEKKEAGDPENPLGRVQLVYDAPRSIHGTNEPQSLGKAASHGSVRISNANGRRLARMVMEAGGAGKDEAFYNRVWENRKERVEVPIPNPVPIRVVAGGSGGGGDDAAEKSGGSTKKGGG